MVMPKHDSTELPHTSLDTLNDGVLALNDQHNEASEEETNTSCGNQHEEPNSNNIVSISISMNDIISLALVFLLGIIMVWMIT